MALSTAKCCAHRRIHGSHSGCLEFCVRGTTKGRAYCPYEGASSAVSRNSSALSFPPLLPPFHRPYRVRRTQAPRFSAHFIHVLDQRRRPTSGPDWFARPCQPVGTGGSFCATGEPAGTNLLSSISLLPFCFRAGVLFVIFFWPEDGGETSIGFQRITERHIPEDRTSAVYIILTAVSSLGASVPDACPLIFVPWASASQASALR